MLGELLGEETGKITCFRVLDGVRGKVEISGHTKGHLLGVHYQGGSHTHRECSPVDSCSEKAREST
jgi:hypothetical protein